MMPATGYEHVVLADLRLAATVATGRRARRDPPRRRSRKRLRRLRRPLPSPSSSPSLSRSARCPRSLRSPRSVVRSAPRSVRSPRSVVRSPRSVVRSAPRSVPARHARRGRPAQPARWSAQPRSARSPRSAGRSGRPLGAALGPLATLGGPLGALGATLGPLATVLVLGTIAPLAAVAAGPALGPLAGLRDGHLGARLGRRPPGCAGSGGRYGPRSRRSPLLLGVTPFGLRLLSRVAYLRVDLLAGRGGGRRDLGPWSRGSGGSAALPLGDRADQLALAHASRPRDAERRGQALQLRQQHRRQPRAATPAAGRGSGGGIASDVGNIRRHVGGVAQWIPSLDRPGLPGIDNQVAGRPRCTRLA